MSRKYFTNSKTVADVRAAVKNVHPNTNMKVTYVSRTFLMEDKEVDVIIERICRLGIHYNKREGATKRASWMKHNYSNIFTVVTNKNSGENYLQITNPVKPKKTKVRYYIEGKLVRDNKTKKLIENKQKELGLTPKSIEGVKSFVKPLNCILKIQVNKK